MNKKKQEARRQLASDPKYKAPAYSLDRVDTYTFRVVKTTFMENGAVEQEVLAEDVHPVAVSTIMGEWFK